MAAATNEQVQIFTDTRVRQRAQQIRALLLSIRDDRAAFGDIYENLTNSPTFVDARGDVPHKATAADLLAWNTLLYDLDTAITGNAQLSAVMALCVLPVSQGF